MDEQLEVLQKNIKDIQGQLNAVTGQFNEQVEFIKEKIKLNQDKADINTDRISKDMREQIKNINILFMELGTLVDLLIDKGAITEDEFLKQIHVTQEKVAKEFAKDKEKDSPIIMPE